MLLLVEKSSRLMLLTIGNILDSMVFWEGLVPTPDVIDAGHRNGVPVYGTLFFNWSNSIADQEKFAEALKQDPDGSFPIARKLVDMAKYYGYDGYFINQETTGDLVEPLGEKMRQFMLYTKARGGILSPTSLFLITKLVDPNRLMFLR